MNQESESHKMPLNRPNEAKKFKEHETESNDEKTTTTKTTTKETETFHM